MVRQKETGDQGMAACHVSMGTDPRVSDYCLASYQLGSSTHYPGARSRTLAFFQSYRYSIVVPMPWCRICRKKLGARLIVWLVGSVVRRSIRCRLSYNSLNRKEIIDADLRIRLRRLRRPLRAHRNESEAVDYVSEVRKHEENDSAVRLCRACQW
jgi:hypothetical protein